MLRISCLRRTSTSEEGASIELVSRTKILAWLAKTAVRPLLLYRRLRYGYSFRLIRLAGPRYAKVDPGDYDRLRKYEWFALKGTRNFYAVRRTRGPKGNRFFTIYMHRELIEVGDGLLTDHVNQDSMDNRRDNLRAATRAQNIRNRKKFSNSSGSKYKGLYRDKKKKRWIARIMFEKKKIHLGYFRDEIEAARAYDRAAMKYHGEFASLNFPQSARG